MRSKRLRILLIVIVIGVVLFVGGPKLLPDLFWQMKINDIQNHAWLWSQRGITKYKIKAHLMIELLSYPGGTSLDCSQELVVENNVVVNTIQNNCSPYILLTVDNQFNIIADKVKSRSCDPEGCQCGITTVDIVYDLQYFYPKTVKTTYDYGSGWIFGPQVWCMGMGGNGTTGIRLETSLFEPIP